MAKCASDIGYFLKIWCNLWGRSFDIQCVHKPILHYPMTSITLLGFPLITVIFFYLFIRELKSAIASTPWAEEKKKKTVQRITIGVVAWAILVSITSLSGFTGNFKLFPVNAMPILLIPLLTTLILLFTADMKTLTGHLNLKVLTHLQVFRVLVEIVLWLLFIQNLLPIQMTFEGRNFDILAGITAIIAARYLVNHKTWMIAWNIFGLLLLINIVVIALLSMPTPIRVFHNEPANLIVTHFPYIFLPTFLVPLAYILHFISLKKLLIKS